MWPDRRLLDLFNIDLPIIQAPMAGANGSAMAVAASAAGALGSLPCAILDEDKIRAEIGIIRQQTAGPLNINFFCHKPEPSDPDVDAAWASTLGPFYDEFGLDRGQSASAPIREPFRESACKIIEDMKPEVVSFHFGLPEAALVQRVKAAGCIVMSSATTAAEARWLEDNGCDVIIAQGYEAGGHRGVFLQDDISTQAGTMALVPQVVDAVNVPVIAAGGISDGRGIAAALALGASAAQIGTAYLFTPESLISDLHRQALLAARDDGTALTNLFSGRPARSLVNRVMRDVGPMSDLAPVFPTAGAALAPLKAAAEARGDSGFSSLWAGQAASLGQEIGAGDLTRKLAADALERLQAISPSTLSS